MNVKSNVRITERRYVRLNHGFGVFATRLIKKDKFIGEYIISAQEGERILGSQDSDSVGVSFTFLPTKRLLGRTQS